MKRWWIIIYPLKEKETILKAIKREKWKIRIYCPMVKASQSHKGIVKMIEEPLLLNYMFWYFDLDELTYEMIREIVPVGILKFNSEFQYVSGREISRIKKIVKKFNNRFDRIRDDVKFLRRYIGRAVVVRDGSLTGMMGKIVDARRSGKVSVELMVFNRPITCELSVEHVEFVKI